MTTVNSLGLLQCQAYDNLSTRTLKASQLVLSSAHGMTDCSFNGQVVLSLPGVVSKASVMQGLYPLASACMARGMADVASVLHQQISVPADHMLIADFDGSSRFGSLLPDSIDMQVRHGSFELDRDNQVIANFRVFTSEVRAVVFINYGCPMAGRHHSLLASRFVTLLANSYSELGGLIAEVFDYGMTNIPLAQAQLAA